MNRILRLGLQFISKVIYDALHTSFKRVDIANIFQDDLYYNVW
jgi:hypothetical protein